MAALILVTDVAAQLRLWHFAVATVDFVLVQELENFGRADVEEYLVRLVFYCCLPDSSRINPCDQVACRLEVAGPAMPGLHGGRRWSALRAH